MQVNELKDVVVTALEDLKGQDIQVLDVKALTDIADYMVIASGTSDTHVKALASKAVDAVKVSGQRPLGIEGENGGEWVLVDFGDVLLHVMLPRTREFYELEKLWGREMLDMVEAHRKAGD